MDLYIETLTGTAFELRVSPFDSIMSIKARIQRLEGEYSYPFCKLTQLQQVTVFIPFNSFTSVVTAYVYIVYMYTCLMREKPSKRRVSCGKNIAPFCILPLLVMTHLKIPCSGVQGCFFTFPCMKHPMLACVLFGNFICLFFDWIFVDHH